MVIDNRVIPFLSQHAKKRIQQRGIPLDAIRWALRLGRAYHARDGVIAFHLGRRQIRKARERGVRIEAFVDIAVLVGQAPDGTLVVVTVTHCTRISRGWRPARVGRAS